MLKYFHIVLFLLISTSSGITQETYEWIETLNWSKDQYSNTAFDSFDGAIPPVNDEDQPKYLKKFNLSGAKFIPTLTIIEESQAGSISDAKLLPNSPKIYSEILTEGRNRQGIVVLYPYYRKNGKVYRINSFKISITEDRQRKVIPTRDLNFKNRSILADGSIYEISITQSGLHKITLDFLRNELNISEAIDANNIKLYGNRGGLLPQSLEDERVDDLVEIPYLLIGGNDNTFDQNDYIIFYAEGADAYKVFNNSYRYEKNHYETNNKYYLKISTEARSNIPKVESIENPEKTFTSYQKHQRYEEDKTNLLGQFASTQGSGKDWYGDYFGLTRSRNYKEKFDLEDLVVGEKINVKYAFAGRGENSHSVIMDINGEEFRTDIRRVNIGNIEARFATRIEKEHSTQAVNGDLHLGISYPRNANNEGWLDYIELSSTHSLTYRKKPLRIKVAESTQLQSTGYEIKQAANVIAWDITNPLAIKEIENAKIIEDRMIFGVNNSMQLREYILFVPSDVVATPQAVGKIDNQNLHAINSAEFIIVYHPDFQESAERLAEYRNQQGINTLAINCHHIFKEFASGKQDPVAIRDFAKMVYDRSPDLKYLLLFGDATYDYRNLMTNLPDDNFVPTYQTTESTHPIEAFPTDDFFGLLSDFEGGDLRGQLEIAVGRIPVSTAEEAHIVIDKIINYESNPDALGDWRLRVGFTADDEDFNIHLNQAEDIARDTENKFPLFNQQKVYFDAYTQESTPGGARYPDASKNLNDNIFKGQLVLNYLGHGGPRGWAQERVLKISDILAWENQDKLPLLITATCSFTGYDDPGLLSAGEYAILREGGGAIGLMTTVRAVYSNENKRLTSAVFDTIFAQDNFQDLTLGETIQRSKNNNWQDTARINARKFALIGDPSMKLAIPREYVRTTSINGQAAESFTDTLGALQKVNIEGIVADRQGNLLQDFNGKVFPTVYGKKTQLTTLRNDTRSREQKFNVQKSILFKGSATVEQGKFSFDFLIPKDIDYSYGPGKISYYAISNNQIDGAGYYDEVIIGGSSDNIDNDDIGPDIDLFINDENFVYGGITGPDPTLLINLEDESGINVSGTSIGHDLTAVLDGDNSNIIVLNDFYESETDNFQKGSVRYPLGDLAPGLHTLNVKAWDTHNNSNEALISFRIVDEKEANIQNLYNFPNPFSTSTQFMFEHDLAGAQLDITLYIYTMSGKVVKTISINQFSQGNRVSDIAWDGRDDFGSQLANGVYLYKVKIHDTGSGLTRESDFNKLVKIR